MFFTVVGRGSLCEKVLRKAISWQPPAWEYIFCGSMHSTIDAQLPQKVPKQKSSQAKNFPNTEKMGDQ